MYTLTYTDDIVLLVEMAMKGKVCSKIQKIFNGKEISIEHRKNKNIEVQEREGKDEKEGMEVERK